MSPFRRSPVQLARVIPDLNATETAPTGRKWVPTPDARLARECCRCQREPADFAAGISWSHPGYTRPELIEPVRAGEHL